MSKARWLLLLYQTNYTLDDLFADINIPFHCEFLVVHKEDGRHFVFTEVYRVDRSLPLRTHQFANLSYLARGFIKRRPDLQGLVLKSAVINSVSCGTSFEPTERKCCIYAL
jgi:hypothetical protein